MGLLDFKLNSSPRPELFSSPGLLLQTPWSAQPQKTRVPNPRKTPWSAQSQRLPGVPNARDSLECPIPETPWSGQFQRFPVPNLRDFLECPTSALPEMPNSRDSLKVGMFEVKKKKYIYIYIYIFFFFFFLGGGVGFDHPFCSSVCSWVEMEFIGAASGFRPQRIFPNPFGGFGFPKP